MMTAIIVILRRLRQVKLVLRPDGCMSCAHIVAILSQFSRGHEPRQPVLVPAQPLKQPRFNVDLTTHPQTWHQGKYQNIV